MPSDAGDETATLSPDDAFALLGDEARVEILQALGEADGPLAFSELRERVGMRDSGQFNYHLDRVTGHFVTRTEEGYELRQSGRRVVQAVLSGAVTETPVLELTRIDEPCQFCGAPITVSFHEERVAMYCPECTGQYGVTEEGDGRFKPEGQGYLGYLPLPPAGVQGRTPAEVHRAAWIWGNLEILSLASGICPRCSATVEREVDVCGDHDAGGRLCEECGSRRAVMLGVDCTNCIFEARGTVIIGLVADTDLLAFLTDHGLNPVSPDSIAAVSRVHDDYGEEVLSTDPLEARLTFDIDGDTLALTVDGDLEVTDTVRE